MACDVRRVATAFYPHNVCGRGRAAFDTQHMRYAARLFGGSTRRKVSPAIEDSANRRGGQATYILYICQIPATLNRGLVILMKLTWKSIPRIQYSHHRLRVFDYPHCELSRGVCLSIPALHVGMYICMSLVSLPTPLSTTNQPTNQPTKRTPPLRPQPYRKRTNPPQPTTLPPQPCTLTSTRMPHICMYVHTYVYIIHMYSMTF